MLNCKIEISLVAVLFGMPAKEFPVNKDAQQGVSDS